MCVDDSVAPGENYYLDKMEISFEKRKITLNDVLFLIMYQIQSARRRRSSSRRRSIVNY